jgi:cytochrome d ubiquinol oxidase subunit II
MTDLTGLPALWLALIGGAWALYLVLGGADLGVSMLVRRVGGPDAAGRAAVLRTVGPTWQANDVWLIIAVAATFGAFPGWYAAWASGLYLPLLAILLALVVRHAGIELLGHLGPVAQRGWTVAVAAAGWVTAIGWGVAWAAALDGSLAAGTADGLGVLSPATVLAGLALAALCRATGAAFLAGRLDGALRERARRELRVAAPAAAVLAAAAAAVLARSAAPGVALGPAGAVALAGAGAALAALAAGGATGRPRVALWAGAAAVAALLAAVLLALAPYGIAGTGAIDLRTEAAGDRTLGLMAAVALVVGPLILLAQAVAYRADGRGRSPFARIARRALRELR